MGKKDIFVDGVPLDEYLSTMEQQERQETVMEHINGVVIYHRHNIPPQIHQRYQDKTITRRGKPRVSRRVRRYSKEEIAEYERRLRMEDKTQSKTKRALAHLKQHGSTTSEELGKAMGWSSSRTAGTLLWRMTQCFPGGIEVDKSTKPYEYRMLPVIRRLDIEELYERFLEYQKSCWRQAEAKRKAARHAPEEPKEAKPEPTTFTRTDIPFDVLSDLVREMVRDILVMPEYTDPTSESTAREINLNVNVRFSFSLGK